MMLKLAHFDKPNWECEMKIYTKTGDKGETSLVDGKRVPKNHPRVDAYGTVDELNSILGVCVSIATSDPGFPTHFDLGNILRIQNTLFNLGSLLACADDKVKMRLPKLEHSDVEFLESQMDLMTAELPALREFVLPGGHTVSSLLHQARTVCRRAERKVIDLESVDNLLVQYLNRLSDYLFVAARFINFKSGTPEIVWKK